MVFLDYAAAFDSPDRERLYEVMKADGLPSKYVNLLREMNRDSKAVVRTGAGRSEPFDVQTGVCQGSVAGPIMFNYVIDNILHRATEGVTDGILLWPSDKILCDLEYADDIVLFAQNTPELQRLIDRIVTFSDAYGLKLRPDKCKQLSVSATPAQPLHIYGEPLEIVDSFCYLGSVVTNTGSFEADIKQRVAKATAAFNLLSRCLWSTSIDSSTKLRVYLIAIRPILLYGSETWSAPSGILSQLNVAERRFMRRMLGYRWPDTYSNEQLYAKVDAIYSKIRHSPSTLPPPSSVVAANRLRLLGHIFRRPPNRLSQLAVRFRGAPSWRRLPGSG
uniref:Reverse transcriptase domain-containing protein n=1 Tax=Plectus sambesii TaxID=2011161 RepID=A0A914WEJ2_9BILA